jgi:hypothetical protein
VTLRDALLPTINAVRAIPGQLGLRPHAVAIIQTISSGAHTGDGARSETETAITESGGQPPKVRWLNDEQLALGNLPKGTVLVGPITPAFSSGGTDLATIQGTALLQGDTLHVKITGPKHPNGALYRVTKINADRALRYMITAEPVSEPL